MIYADTSFIASVYGPDVNTPAARGFIESSQPCLPISFFALAGTGPSVLDQPSVKRGKTLGLGASGSGRPKKTVSFGVVGGNLVPLGEYREKKSPGERVPED